MSFGLYVPIASGDIVPSSCVSTAPSGPVLAIVTSQVPSDRGLP